MKKNLILNSEEIKQKTKRIAYQIVEDNYDETEIVMIGIKPNGFEYAEQLKKEFDAVLLAEKCAKLLIAPPPPKSAAENAFG